MKKIILLLILITIAIILIVIYKPEVANNGSEVIVDTNIEGKVVVQTPIEDGSYCKDDSDCVLETEINSSCSHVCVLDECTDELRLCDAYYKNGEEAKEKEEQMCFWNEPCKEPVLVECSAGKCVVG